MINTSYINKIEEYVKQREEKGSAKISTKGLLAPKRKNKMGAKQQQVTNTAIKTVGEYVYALRQKRNELKDKRDTNGNK